MSGIGDRQITTWLSKQVVFDHSILTALSSGDSDYFVICIHPDARDLLLSALNFYSEWLDRWVNFPDEQARLDLIGRANDALMAPMACSEDVQLIIDNLASIALSQTQIRDNVAAQTTAISTKLDTTNGQLTAIRTAIELLDPALFNDIENVMIEVVKILGGVAIGID